MTQNKIVWLVLLTIFVLLVVLPVFVYYCTPFSFSKIINITLNPSIIITAILAIYVTGVLAKQNDRDKQGKELLIEYFKDFQQEFHKRKLEILNHKTYDAPLFNSHLKFLRIKLRSSIKLAEQDKTDNAKALHEKIKSIWEILTDESHYDEQGLKLEYKTKIDFYIVEVDELIFFIIKEINKTK